MPTRSEAEPSVDLVEGASGVLVGGGIITMALFPLALPLLVLTAVAALPLVLVALAAGLVAAALAAPVLLIRRLGRREIRMPSAASGAEAGRS